MTAPHTPWLPTEAFQGKSSAGYYGDFVAQVDAVVGQVMAALSEQGLAENTLLIFTSDNGAHWLPTEIDQYGHMANGAWRGQKADIFEGGHRVPFIAKWPSHIPTGRVSALPMMHTDLLATIAAIVNVSLVNGAGPDSFSFLPTLLGNPEKQRPRPALIHHSLHGFFAIRENKRKLVDGSLRISVGQLVVGLTRQYQMNLLCGLE